MKFINILIFIKCAIVVLLTVGIAYFIYKTYKENNYSTQTKKNTNDDSKTAANSNTTSSFEIKEKPFIFISEKEKVKNEIDKGIGNSIITNNNKNSQFYNAGKNFAIRSEDPKKINDQNLLPTNGNIEQYQTVKEVKIPFNENNSNIEHDFINCIDSFCEICKKKKFEKINLKNDKDKENFPDNDFNIRNDFKNYFKDQNHSTKKIYSENFDQITPENDHKLKTEAFKKIINLKASINTDLISKQNDLQSDQKKFSCEKCKKRY